MCLKTQNIFSDSGESRQTIEGTREVGRSAKNCQQSRTEAELVWTRATEVKWKHMAGLGSTLEVTVAAYFQAGYEVEN